MKETSVQIDGAEVPTPPSVGTPAMGKMNTEASPPNTSQKTEDHAGHKAKAISSDKVKMAHEMGHGAGEDMEGMVRDMRNRLLVTLVLTFVIYLYAPMFVKLTGLVLPVPFGLSKDVLMF